MKATRTEETSSFYSWFLNNCQWKKVRKNRKIKSNHRQDCEFRGFWVFCLPDFFTWNHDGIDYILVSRTFLLKIAKIGLSSKIKKPQIMNVILSHVADENMAAQVQDKTKQRLIGRLGYAINKICQKGWSEKHLILKPGTIRGGCVMFKIHNFTIVLPKRIH